MTLRQHLPNTSVVDATAPGPPAVAAPVDPATNAPVVPPAFAPRAAAASPPALPESRTLPGSPPRTKISATWLGVCAAALTLVVLIVFMLQNTRTVEVSFLWLHGNVPLALVTVGT